MSAGTAVWLVLLLGLVALELFARLGPRRLARPLLAPLQGARRLAWHSTGRAALLLAWAFAGIHLFARHRLVP